MYSRKISTSWNVDGVMFIGYHRRMRATNAILDHTWSDGRISGVWLSDREDKVETTQVKLP